MSLLQADQSYLANFDMFIGTPTKNDRLHEAPITETPTPKRRRGRPSKCPQIVDGQPSPAANSSAAVMKQGSPKASAPLMRVSPLSSKRSSLNSSPLQHKSVLPSPKGGTLMKMDLGRAQSDRKKTHKKNAFYSMLPSKNSSAAQQNIHSITAGTMTGSSKLGSLNPCLLLSSPISTSKINEINKSRVPMDTKRNTEKSIAPLSSPMTPNSVSSSCFSSIMRSSPLYHGYYANQSSPGTSIISSSPMKLQMKPLNEVKAHLRKVAKSFQSNDLVSEASPIEEEKGNFKLTFGIDEFGQAKIIKVRVPEKDEPELKSVSTPKKLTRHQSLATLPTLSTIGRTSSLSSIPTLKSNDLGLFIEPSKMTTDASFFNSISDELGYESISTPLHHEEFNFADELSTTSEEGLMLDVSDEATDCDARNALMKMIRRSV